MRAGLAHHRVHATLAEPVEHRGEVEPAVRARRRDEEHTRLAKLVRAADVSISRDKDHGALRILRAHDLGGGRSARVGVDDDAQGVPSLDLANGQRGIVGEHGPDPDKDRIGAVAQSMYLPQRGLAREIAPTRHRDASVDGGGELQQHERPSALESRHESRVEALSLLLEDPLLDLDPRGAQPANALAVGARIGVAHRDDDARDLRIADRIDARRRAALVRARLEVREESGAARFLAGFAESVDLSVRLAGRAVITLADDLAVPDHDGAHERIGAGPARRARREAERATHVSRVRVGHGC
ncbi:MAG: hypothetical protein AUI15_01305 [Actinobacteria bacterium 13_2_20CM_2_66_6]|nr:MAG: hypothetical protein AUI15_01305 [Actinobacteria bacterium 13_2_20CM_2_66_6]